MHSLDQCKCSDNTNGGYIIVGEGGLSGKSNMMCTDKYIKRSRKAGQLCVASLQCLFCGLLVTVVRGKGWQP